MCVFICTLWRMNTHIHMYAMMSYTYLHIWVPDADASYKCVHIKCIHMMMYAWRTSVYIIWIHKCIHHVNSLDMNALHMNTFVWCIRWCMHVVQVHTSYEFISSYEVHSYEVCSYEVHSYEVCSMHSVSSAFTSHYRLRRSQISTSVSRQITISAYLKTRALIWRVTATYCNTLYNTLQHTSTHCNTLQHTATHCNTLQHTATHCNTLQHTAIHKFIWSAFIWSMKYA